MPQDQPARSAADLAGAVFGSQSTGQGSSPKTQTQHNTPPTSHREAKIPEDVLMETVGEAPADDITENIDALLAAAGADTGTDTVSIEEEDAGSGAPIIPTVETRGAVRPEAPPNSGPPIDTDLGEVLTVIADNQDTGGWLPAQGAKTNEGAAAASAYSPNAEELGGIKGSLEALLREATENGRATKSIQNKLDVLAAFVHYDGERLAAFLDAYTRNPFRRIGGAVAGAARYVSRALADNALRATFGYVKSDNPLVALRARLNLWAAAKLDPKNAGVHSQYAHYLLLDGNASRASAYASRALRILEQNPHDYNPTEADKIKTQAALVKERATYHLGEIGLESIARNSPLPYGRYAPIHARTFR